MFPLHSNIFIQDKEEEEEKIRDPFKDRLPIKIGDKVVQTRISLQRIIFHNRDKRIIPYFLFITTFLSKEEEEEEKIRDPFKDHIPIKIGDKVGANEDFLIYSHGRRMNIH